MRVTLTTEGGLAALPGLAAPVVLDLDALPAQVAARVRTLASMALQQGSATTQPGPDARSYTLQIEIDGEVTALHYADPVQDTAAQALIDFCTTHGRAQRGRTAPGRK